jgi:hypothetical protein
VAGLETPRLERLGTLIDISLPALAWTHAATMRLTIPPDVVRTVDIGRIYEKPPDVELADTFELSIDPPPQDGRHRLGAGTYDLEFTLSARNADALSYRTTRVFDPSKPSSTEWS